MVIGRPLISAPCALGLFFALVLQWSLQAGWNATFGPFLRWLANLGISFSVRVAHVNLHPFGYAHTLDTNVQKWLSQGIALSEKGFVKMLWWTVEPFVLFIGVFVAIVYSLYELGRYLTGEVHKKVGRTEHTTTIEKTRTVVKTQGAVTKVQFNHLSAREAAVEKRVHTLEVAATGSVAAPFPRVGPAVKDAAVGKIKVGKLSWLLAYTGLLTFGLSLLRRLGLSWLRCPRVGKVGKAVCGMNPRLVESLLFDVATLTLAFNLREFVGEMQTVAEQSAKLIQKLAE